MYSIKSGLLLAALSPVVRSAPQNVPVRAVRNVTLGTQTDFDFNTDLRHDGSIFATANGYTVQIFQDSITYTNNSLTSFVSNSVAYVGLNGGNPLNLTTLGGLESQPVGEKTFAYSPGMWPQRDNETGTTALWPSGSAAILPDNQTVLMFTGVLARMQPATVTLQYNAMITLQIVDPTTLTGSELPPLGRPSAADTYYAFWFANEPTYGSFATLVNRQQNLLYTYASDSTGIKMARAPMANEGYASRANYHYYDNSTSKWTTQIPALNDGTTNIIDFDSKAAGGEINSGSIFWSEFHNTFIALIFNNLYNRRIWSTYSLSGTPDGPWAEIDYTNVIYTPDVDPRCDDAANNSGPYAFHAAPGWDPSGQSVLIATSGCAIYTVAAQIYWA